jgi:hypothetical protein
MVKMPKQAKNLKFSILLSLVMCNRMDGILEGGSTRMKSFDTHFNDATSEECQKWNNERCRHDRAPIGTLLAIVDARSARDRTLLLQRYIHPPAGTEEFTFGGYGVLPLETNVWYDSRVDHRYAGQTEATYVLRRRILRFHSSLVTRRGSQMKKGCSTWKGAIGTVCERVPM